MKSNNSLLSKCPRCKAIAGDKEFECSSCGIVYREYQQGKVNLINKAKLEFNNNNFQASIDIFKEIALAFPELRDKCLLNIEKIKNVTKSCRMCGKLVIISNDICDDCRENEGCNKKYVASEVCKKCYCCGEPVLEAAEKCKHCGEIFDNKIKFIISARDKWNAICSFLLKPVSIVIIFAVVACLFSYFLLQKNEQFARDTKVDNVNNLNKQRPANIYIVTLHQAKDNISAAQKVCYNVCDTYWMKWDKGKNNMSTSYDIELEFMKLKKAMLQPEHELNVLTRYKKEIDALMEKLGQPPAVYKRAYEELVILYSLYTQFNDLAFSSPPGTINSYKNRFESINHKIDSQIEILEILFPPEPAR